MSMKCLLYMIWKSKQLGPYVCNCVQLGSILNDSSVLTSSLLACEFGKTNTQTTHWVLSVDLSAEYSLLGGRPAPAPALLSVSGIGPVHPVWKHLQRWCTFPPPNMVIVKMPSEIEPPPLSTTNNSSRKTATNSDTSDQLLQAPLGVSQLLPLLCLPQPCLMGAGKTKRLGARTSG